MATKTYYLGNGIASNVHQTLTEDDPGTDATTTPNYGFAPGTTAANNYASADAQTMVAAGAFSTTVQPDGSLVTGQAVGDAWRTPVPLTGTFTSPTFTIEDAAVQIGAGLGAKGKFGVRIFEGAASDGSDATEITSGNNLSAEMTHNVAQQKVSTTVTPGTFSVTNKFLFFQRGYLITTAASGKGASAFSFAWRTGTTASKITITNFTPTANQTESIMPITMSSVSDGSGQIAWTAPSNAIKPEGNVAQYISTPFTTGETSENLRATNFGFSVPSTATITKIEAYVDRNADQATAILGRDVFLVVGGAESGNDKSNVSYWPTTLTIRKYTWEPPGDSMPTAAQVNASDFGFQIQVNNSLGNSEIGRVDHMWMIIYYTDAAGTPMLTLMGVGV